VTAKYPTTRIVARFHCGPLFKKL